jgi:hypothetical protein
MPHILLPRYVTNGRTRRDCTWPPAQAGGVVQIEPQGIVQNLLWTDSLEARGYSDPWAPARAFEARLRHGAAPAIDVLELLLLFPFLGLVEFRRLVLRRDDPSVLKRTLARSSPTIDQNTDTGLYLLRRGDGSLSVIAGSVSPRWTIFPSATYSDLNAGERLRRVLLELRGEESPDPALSFRSGRIELLDNSLRDQFRSLVRSLAQSERVADGGPWRSHLVQLARGAEPLTGWVAPPELLPMGTRQAEWACPQHQVEGRQWSLDSAIPEVVIDVVQTRVLCAAHHVELVVGGTTVRLEALGAGVLVSGDQKKLIFWVDELPSADLKSVEDTSTDRMLAYRGVNGPRFRIRGSPLTLKNVQCEPMSVPPGPDGGPTSTLPLRSEFLGLLESQEWNAGRSLWSLRLKGRSKAFEVAGAPFTAGDIDSGSVVWPREVPARWNMSIVGAYSVADGVGLVSADEQGAVHGPLWQGAVFLADQGGVEPKFWVYRKGGVDRGAIPIPRRGSTPTLESGTAAYLAVDFGTSSTTVAFRLPGSAGNTFVQHGVARPSEECLMPSVGAKFPGSLLEALGVFSAWYATTSPSPLLGTLLVRKRTTNGGGEQHAVVPREPALIRHLKPDPRTDILADLKWRDPAHSPRNAMVQYLTRVMIPAVHELALAGASEVRVAASYPLAFDRTRLAQFQGSMEEAVKLLERASGLKFAPPGYLSESHAGIQALAAEFADLRMTIDLGGGTTDLALLGSRDQVLAAESIRIGGRDLLSALCGKQDPASIRSRLASRLFNGALDGAAGLPIYALIETLYQSAGATAVLAELQPVNQIEVRQACGALLAAIALAARQLLRATGLGGPARVNVAFLGQGWLIVDPHLMLGLSETAVFEVLEKEVAPAFQLSRVPPPPDPRKRKLLLAEGALSQAVSRWPLRRPDNGSSSLGMDLRLRDGSVLEASLPIGRFPQGGEMAAGDPGFAGVVEDLVRLMRGLGSAGVSMGDPAMWLDGAHPEFPAQSRRKRITDEGCTTLRNLMAAAGGGIDHSPLAAFLSGPWREAWSGVKETS